MDAQEFWKKHNELTEEILKICPSDVSRYVVENLTRVFNSFTSSERDIWIRHIGTNPIIKRVLLYTYCPPDMIDFRQQMDTIVDPMRDSAQIWKVLEIKELQDSPIIIKFLEETAWQCGIVATVDRQKRDGGIEGSVEALRGRLYSVDVNENNERKITKIIRDEIPWMRSEHIMIKEANGHRSQEIHIYLLDDNLVKKIFDNWTDEASIVWMQCFKGFQDIQNTAYSSEVEVYIHDKESAVMKPPKGKRNPFKRGLKQKYEPLLKSIPKKYRQDRDRTNFSSEKFSPEEAKRYQDDEKRMAWDAERIFRDAIINWQPGITPPAYFENALHWRFKNLEKRFDKLMISKDELERMGISSFSNSSWNLSEKEAEDVKISYPNSDKKAQIIKVKDRGKKAKYFKIEDIDRTGGSLDQPISDEREEETRRDIIVLTDPWGNPIDPMDDGIKQIDFRSKINNFMSSLDHPADKLIFVDLIESRDMGSQITTNATLSKKLQTQGIKLSPQRVGQRREVIIEKIKKSFQTEE